MQSARRQDEAKSPPKNRKNDVIFRTTGVLNRCCPLVSPLPVGRREQIANGLAPPTGNGEQIYLSLRDRDRRSRREDTFFEPKCSIRFFRYYIKFLNKENMHTYSYTVFCCIPMAVFHRWSRYLPIYISFARSMFS